MIEVKNVFKQYTIGNYKQIALNDVTLQIPDAKSVAIVGRSGSGKSTLMHIISGLDKPTFGQVVVDGTDIHNLSKSQKDIFRNQHMGFVFQTFFVFPRQLVWENVATPLTIAGHSKERRLAEALKFLEMVDMSYAAQKRAYELSGGEKQRICVARALITLPRYVFADEPTGNLDPSTGNLVEKVLFGVNKQLKSTLIIVTHNMELAHKCEAIITVDHGNIVDVKDKS